MRFCTFSRDVLVGSYTSKSCLVSTSQLADLTPLPLTASSILCLHCTQAPNTLKLVLLSFITGPCANSITPGNSSIKKSIYFINFIIIKIYLLKRIKENKYFFNALISYPFLAFAFVFTTVMSIPQSAHFPGLSKV